MAQLEQPGPDIRTAHVVQVADVPVCQQHLCSDDVAEVVWDTMEGTDAWASKTD
jgi:hypothetical protein